MSKKDCNICMDLMPLVKDGVASRESLDFVNKHIENCQDCKDLFNCQEGLEENLDQDLVLNRLKRNIRNTGLVVLILGSLLGAGLSNSMGMFYNFLIMPILGGIGYMVFGKKNYRLYILIFTISYSFQLIQSLIEGREGLIYNFTEPIFLSVVYLVFAFIGEVIFKLLKFAFSKEEKNE